MRFSPGFFIFCINLLFRQQLTYPRGAAAWSSPRDGRGTGQPHMPAPRPRGKRGRASTTQAVGRQVGRQTTTDSSNTQRERERERESVCVCVRERESRQSRAERHCHLRDDARDFPRTRLLNVEKTKNSPTPGSCA